MGTVSKKFLRRSSVNGRLRIVSAMITPSWLKRPVRWAAK
jgi:hypothetical protein